MKLVLSSYYIRVEHLSADLLDLIYNLSKYSVDLLGTDKPTVCFPCPETKSNLKVMYTAAGFVTATGKKKKKDFLQSHI